MEVSSEWYLREGDWGVGGEGYCSGGRYEPW